MMSDTDDCISYIALALCIARKKKRMPRKKRIWMKEWLKKRRNRFQYTHENLLNELKISARDDYKKLIRMDKSTYEELLNIISPLIMKKDTFMREAIPVSQRLSTTMRYLATGDSFEDLKFATAISAISISRIVMETCEAIIRGLNEYIKIPQTQDQWKQIAEGFNDRWNFPNCLGAIDGKHVAIKKPPHSGSYYYNYKKFFSVVLMAVVDSNYKFIVADVGVNDRISDGGVFNQTSFGNAFLENSINIPEPDKLPSSEKKVPYVFLADDAFQLTEYLMKPYAETGLGDNERVFNYRLRRARSVVENAFGILTSRFGVFQRPIQLSPEKTQAVVLACCYLHNFLRRKSAPQYIPSGSFDTEDLETGIIIEGSWRRSNKLLISLQNSQSRDSSNIAKHVRQVYCEYFNNQGQVSWQNNVRNLV